MSYVNAAFVEAGGKKSIGLPLLLTNVIVLIILIFPKIHRSSGESSHRIIATGAGKFGNLLLN